MISNVEASNMTDEEFYNVVMSEKNDINEKPINTSQYPLEEQLEIFRKANQDEESRKLLIEDIAALT
ncbi:MAG: hypothetical protein LBH98_02755 [Chitinispirillales bacterium]|jgi:hypothetical protein|nr:hypothetical protein [Chitinispirillales bacterium]